VKTIAIYILLSTIYLLISTLFISKIRKTNILNAKQKALNTALVLLLPFFWPVVIHYLLKKQPGSYEIPIKNDSSGNGFYESGIAVNNNHPL